jgi:hypothetical protein
MLYSSLQLWMRSDSSPKNFNANNERIYAPTKKIILLDAEILSFSIIIFN